MQAANAMGGKTARACDGCMRRRARWYCSADDAFLCQACDVSIHSANQLASRHERVRLRSSSLSSRPSPIRSTSTSEARAPRWHEGVTRKPRTPRNHGSKAVNGLQSKKLNGSLMGNENHVDPLVPEIGVEDGSLSSTDENEEASVFRVPEFDPFVETQLVKHELMDFNIGEVGISVLDGGFNGRLDEGKESFERIDGGLDAFLPPEMDLVELAFDVETLLGSEGGAINHDDSKVDAKQLGLCAFEHEKNDADAYDYRNGDNNSYVDGGHEVAQRVKEEEQEILAGRNTTGGVNFEDIEWKLDCDFAVAQEGEAAEGIEEEKLVVPVKVEGHCEIGDAHAHGEKKRKMFLRLNYEDVIASWAAQGSPWTNGSRPDFSLGDCWPDCLLGMCPKHLHCPSGDAAAMPGHRGSSADGAREARVSRYREKRRTRLFAKKIRYEVRKLNAEKRPRIKGRFVKRTALIGACF